MTNLKAVPNIISRLAKISEEARAKESVKEEVEKKKRAEAFLQRVKDLETGLLFCDFHKIKWVHRQDNWGREPAHDVQKEAIRRFGKAGEEALEASATHYNRWSRDAHARALNMLIEEAKRERAPLEWPSSEEMLKHFSKDYTKKVDARSSLRAEALALLGGACEVCGIVDERLLEIDHKHNDGAEARRAGFIGDNLYRDVLKRGRAEYQILCGNDNKLKYREHLAEERGHKK